MVRYPELQNYLLGLINDVLQRTSESQFWHMM